MYNFQKAVFLTGKWTKPKYAYDVIIFIETIKCVVVKEEDAALEVFTNFLDYWV